jgi:hypothetical protein
MDEDPAIHVHHTHDYRHRHRHVFEREHEVDAERSPMVHNPLPHGEVYTAGRKGEPSYETYEQNRTPIRRRPLG